MPWVEVDNRQSNFDEATGRFVVASDNAVIDGVEVGRYLQTYSKKRLRARASASPTTSRGDGRTIVRGGFGVFWNFTPGGTSSSKAQNPPFLQSTALTTNVGQTTLRVQDGLPPPPGVDPNRPAGRARRGRSSTSTSATATPTTGTSTSSRQLGAQLHGRARLRRLARPPDDAQGRPEPGAAGRRRHQRRTSTVRTPRCRRRCAASARCRATGTLDYHGLLVKFQRRFADNFSVLNSYTYGKAIDLNSDNDGGVTLTNVYDPQYNRGPSDYDVKHTLSSSWIYELPFGPRGTGGAAGRPTASSTCARACPLTITQTQGVQSTGTGNRPNRIGDGAGRRSDDRRSGSTRRRFAVAARHHRHLRRRRPQHPARTGQFNIDFSVIKSTKFGRIDTEFRVEAFNLLNHPQFAQPNGTFGNAAFGQITAMLANPSCALCGTTERQHPGRVQDEVLIDRRLASRPAATPLA